MEAPKPRPSPASTVERTVAVAAIAGLAVLLWGGYARHWGWTGFGDNDHLWDWLKLLALPLALALLPVWLRGRDRMGPRRRRLSGLALVAFFVLVVAGYVVPLLWTGFVGNTLWDWLNLLVLPAAAATVVFWHEGRSELRPPHRLLLGVVALALAVAILGGYLLDWSWTGFSGKALWDWLTLLIAPLVLPTVLLPVAAAWVAEEELAGRAPPGEAAAGPPPPIPAGARHALGALAVLTAGGIIAVALVPHHPEGETTGDRSHAAATPSPCRDPRATTVLADATAKVVRNGGGFVACPAYGRPVRLGVAGRGAPKQFRLRAGRVVFLQDRCARGHTCDSRVMVLRLGPHSSPFARMHFAGTRGSSGLYVGPRAAVAVMLRGADGGGRLYVQDTHGKRLVDDGPGVDATSLTGQGPWVYWRDGGRARVIELQV
jgi:hypothetical protein